VLEEYVKYSGKDIIKTIQHFHAEDETGKLGSAVFSKLELVHTGELLKALELKI
jgi:hypothetical protein